MLPNTLQTQYQPQKNYRNMFYDNYLPQNQFQEQNNHYEVELSPQPTKKPEYLKIFKKTQQSKQSKPRQNPSTIGKGGYNYKRINEQKRLQLLQILKNQPHASNNQIGRQTQLSRTKIMHIRRQYELTGDVRVTEGGNHKSFQRMQTEQKQIKAILAVLKSEPRAGLRTFAIILQQQYGIIIRKSSIYKRLIKMGYEYTALSLIYSPIPIVNDESTILSRGYFAKELQRYKLNDLFVCGITTFTNSNSANYGWLPKSANNRILPLQTSISTNQPSVNLLLTLSYNKIIYFRIIERQLKVEDLIDQLRNGYMSSSKKIITQAMIIQEQVYTKINKQKKFQTKQQDDTIKLEGEGPEIKSKKSKSVLDQIMSSFNIQYLLLPSYSPTLSPCYPFFQVMHKKFKAYCTLNKKVNSTEQISTGVKKIMHLMSQSEIPNYFTKIATYIGIKDTKGVKIEDFVEYSQNQNP